MKVVWRTENLEVLDAAEAKVHVKVVRICPKGNCFYETETTMEDDKAAFKARMIEYFKAEHAAAATAMDEEQEMIDDLAKEIADGLNESEAE